MKDENDENNNKNKNENEIHEKIKYGDLIYIEFQPEKKRTRNILTGGEFTIDGISDIEIKEIILENTFIYLKDFEQNLFIIFPKMKDEFMYNKTLLNDGLALLKEKIKTSKTLVYDNEFKNNITKVIRAFQRAKEDVYSENEKFVEDIGQPINYEDDFILIHFKTQSFVQRSENNKSTALSLTPNYSDECIFFFSSSSSYNLNLRYVFSNQNLLICKREKNLYSNNLSLTVKPKSKEKNINLNNNNDIDNTKEKEINQGNTEFTLDFKEGHGQEFQVKICSEYIDPSSSNLTFATPVWITVQSIDKFLNILTFPKIESVNLENEIINNNNNNEPQIENNENINTNNILPNTNTNSVENNIINTKNLQRNRSMTNTNNLINNNTHKNNNVPKHVKMKTDLEKNNLINRLNSNTTNTENKYHPSSNNYKISFDSTDKEKAINNINGLFYIEQYEQKLDIKSLTDEYLKENLKMQEELKMESSVKYHKIVRIRHIISKKYLGFQEKRFENKRSNNENNETEKGKTNGNLILLDAPDDNCNWMLLESYQNLESKKYLESKINGMDKGDINEESEEDEEDEEKKIESDENKLNKENKENIKDDKQKIKNNEILRIFHIKTQKFLCFDEVTNKIGNLNKTKTLVKEDLYNPTPEKKITVHNLTLSIVPYDSDLVRFIPFEANQSMEIFIVLYFKNQLDEEVDFITNKNYRNLSLLTKFSSKKLKLKYA